MFERSENKSENFEKLQLKRFKRRFFFMSFQMAFHPPHFRAIGMLFASTCTFKQYTHIRPMAADFDFQPKCWEPIWFALAIAFATFNIGIRMEIKASSVFISCVLFTFYIHCNWKCHFFHGGMCNLFVFNVSNQFDSINWTFKQITNEQKKKKNAKRTNQIYHFIWTKWINVRHVFFVRLQ